MVCGEEFLAIKVLYSFIEEYFTSTSYNQLETEEFEVIDYLCYIEDGKYFFQKVSRANLVRRRKMIFGDVAEYKKECQEIVIHPEADAIYLKEKDQLVFIKLSTISSIFKGIDILYREATEEETCRFLSQKVIVLENFSSENVNKANRKRIAMANNLLKCMKKEKKKTIFKSIKEYCPQLLTEQGKFRISSDRDLKLLLYGIDQRFYTTPDGEEKGIANSIIRLK